MIDYTSDVTFWQRFLKSHGFYTDTIDGDWGPNSQSAADAFEAEYESIAGDLGRFDARTEKGILTLAPSAQRKAREFMAAILAADIPAKIISGTRTYRKQNVLYAQGRTEPGDIVTNARGGYSNHQFGIAWDIGIFEGGTYHGESHYYDDAGTIGRDIVLWGGDWQGFVDKPHYQLLPNSALADIRGKFEQGSPYLAA